MNRNKLIRSIFLLSVLLLLGCTSSARANNEKNGKPKRTVKTDVCVYSATPSGIMAAYAVKRAGHSVVIVEPGKWVGGMLGAGLKPVQDMPNYTAVGGKTRELMLKLGVARNAENTDLEEVRRLSREEMSPKDVRESFLKFLNDHEIQLIYDHRISRTTKSGQNIKKAFFDHAPYNELGRPVAKALAHENLEVEASMFIDASYTGELMARSGVSYRVGRESKLDYGEKFGGVRPFSNLTPISPFKEKGQPASGLLPLVKPDHGKPHGAGDHHTQAYNFRYYVTSDPEKKIPFEPPANYNPQDYELAGRYVNYLKAHTDDRKALFNRLSRIFPGWLNEGEYNYQRKSLITMAPVGISHRFADGDYATKARIWKAHQEYLRGLHHFMSTDKRVPKAFREKTAALGREKGHHPETNGWPHQLYIRVSRRMTGRYTITAHDVYNRTEVSDPIGLAQYGIDTYPSRRTWIERNDTVYTALEGKMFVGGAKGPTNRPYPVPYRSITPLKQECTNLLVPVCFSASHLGYASARMEPVFMIVGESAGVAASQALEENGAVQDIDLSRYMKQLKAFDQRLNWSKIQKEK